MDQAKDLLRDHLSTRQHHPYALAIVSGGGSKSAFFLSETTSFLQHQYGIKTPHSLTVPLPCSKGALTQHMLQEDSLPNACHWYIAQSEPYDSKRHRDAKRFARLREHSEYVTGEVMVHDRLVRLMSYTAQEGFQPRRPLLQRFAIEVGPLGRLHLVCYWSERRRAEHSSVYDVEDRRKEGLRSHPVMFDLPDLRHHHFDTHDDGGKHYHLVFAFIEMHGDETSLRVTATIMIPTFSPDRMSERNQEWQSFTDEIWTPSSSPFVSQHTGPTGARCHTRYRDTGRALPTTESRSQRLRSVSVFAPDYGSADLSEDETVQGRNANPIHHESAHADAFVASTRSSRKRAREDPQSPQGRRTGGRLLVRQRFPDARRSFYPPTSIHSARHAVTRSSEDSPSPAESLFSGQSPRDTPSLGPFPFTTAVSSTEPIDRSHSFARSPNMARSFTPNLSPNLTYADSEVLLQKCE